ncbi:hypothetical protein CLCR_00119 [Cladophialophora carrionii]|uniref:Flavin reductase like domain-containing protein n=1 Tax=Cladophialophora carrionii TaxID=86049 RepID=A0A1C1C6E9_9EURO|nr:hypothetical protein CLCR_00119 [Cladophialophora carrionii]
MDGEPAASVGPAPIPASRLAKLEAFDKEALVQRNPHADFAAVQASRPDYDQRRTWTCTKTPSPGWQPGDGASKADDGTAWRKHALLAIDPDSPDRTPNQNYKLMISSTVPRPIALVSTLSKEGIANLAPFSYFNCVSNDPPLYSVSFVGEDPCDSLRNVLDTGELCISVISDWYLEAANFTSVNTAPLVSEWPLAGLHPAPSQRVKPPHVTEAAFSVECKLHSAVPIMSKTRTNVGDGSPVRTATLVLVEAVMYHVREDVVDERQQTINISKLRPVWRGGGITYGVCLDGWETPRPAAMKQLLQTARVQDILAKEGYVQENQ